MVKINLKKPQTTPEEDIFPPGREEPKKYSTPAGPSRRKDTIDLSFDSTESFFDKTEMEPPLEEKIEPFVDESDTVVRKKEEIPETNSTFLGSERDIGYKNPFVQNKIFYILGIVAIFLIVIIFVIMKFWGADKELRTASEIAAERLLSEEAASEKSTSESLLMPVFRQNVSTNQTLNDQLQKLLEHQSATAKYSLIVMTPSEINMTILAASRDDVARFHLDLKKAFPELGFDIVSVQSKLENGHPMIYADLSAELKGATAAASAPIEPATRKIDDISRELRRLAEQHGVGIQYWKEGKNIPQKGYEEVFYYIQASGSRANLLNFFSDLSRQYPMLKINKFSIYPDNLDTISDKKLSSRLNLTYYRMN
ncbi:MAG: hypothetical protein Kow0042_12440 [Calditrichia bacterium]